jgi:agmatinase
MEAFDTLLTFGVVPIAPLYSHYQHIFLPRPYQDWISLDIDVVDPGLAPGTGTPEPGGMLSRELLRGLRQIAAQVPIAGMDIVEVSPPYDWAESTAMIANRAALEVISALAKRKESGETIRWEPSR